MSNSVFRSKIKFLFDENVDVRLGWFLQEQGFDAIFKPKGFKNGKLAEFSKSEERVLVTNDDDFTNSEQFPREKIFSVVWLRIPQNKPIKVSQDSFSKLLTELSNPEDFKSKLIMLYEDGFKSEPLAE